MTGLALERRTYCIMFIGGREAGEGEEEKEEREKGTAAEYDKKNGNKF